MRYPYRLRGLFGKKDRRTLEMGSSVLLLCIIPCLLCQETVGFSRLPKRPLVRVIADTIRFILRVTRPFSDTVLDLLYSVLIGKTRELPPIDNKILLMSATELAHKIRRREISSEEVVRAYVERSKSIHPMINAVVDERYEDALEEAREVDRFLATSEKTEEEIADETPLFGLPFTSKEYIGVKGLAQTMGLVRQKSHKASVDGDATALYRKAGAIPVTVTNVPELLLWWESANQVFGLTRNPYDNRRTVGGSSGGEAAIITSAGALFGFGNDYAGSIRIPSSFNGIYGHKPSRGVVSNKAGIIPDEPAYDPNGYNDDFVSTGPMCRYVEDLPLLLRILANNDTRIQLDRKVDFTKLTVYYMEEFPGYLAAAVPVVKDAINKAVKYFQHQFGTKIIKLKMDEMLHAQNIWESKLLEYGGAPVASLLAGNGKTMNLHLELLKSILGHSNHTFPVIYYAIIERLKKDVFYHKYLKMFQEIERKLNQTLLNEDAILLVPTHPEEPPHYLMTIPKYPNLGYVSIFNVLGLPSTNIPAGLSDKGLPFGIQAISGRFHDHLSLAAALELDKMFKGWKSPSPITVRGTILS